MPYRKGSSMDLSTGNIATALVLFYAVVGAAIVILSAAGVVTDHDLTLSFAKYLEQMAIAAGGLAIGRGLAARKR